MTKSRNGMGTWLNLYNSSDLKHYAYHNAWKNSQFCRICSPLPPQKNVGLNPLADGDCADCGDDDDSGRWVVTVTVAVAVKGGGGTGGGAVAFTGFTITFFYKSSIYAPCIE